MEYLLFRLVIEGDNPSITQVITAGLFNAIFIPAQIFGYACLIAYAAKLVWVG